MFVELHLQMYYKNSYFETGKVADKLILLNQTAFMKNRDIMNGILALHEILHETKRKNEVGIILKLDFEKAYDKICWEFHFDCLKIRGFCAT